MEPSIPSWFLESPAVHFFAMVALVLAGLFLTGIVIAVIEIKSDRVLGHYIDLVVSFFSNDSLNKYQGG